MKYQVVYTEKAVKQLAKLDGSVKRLILSWVEKNLLNCENPRLRGKALTANRKGEWRYCIGNYRLICQICDDQLIILALSVGHRGQIY